MVEVKVKDSAFKCWVFRGLAVSTAAHTLDKYVS